MLTAFFRGATKKAHNAFSPRYYSTSNKKVWDFTQKNTLFYTVPRLFDGRENFVERDTEREEMSRKIQQKFNNGFSNSDDIENIKIVGERGWVIKDDKMTKGFIEKVNSLLSKFKKIRTITVLCCLSEDVARLLSERHPNIKFVGVDVPVITSYPIKVGKIKDGVVVSGSGFDIAQFPIAQENIHIFRNGVEVIDARRAEIISAMLSSGIYNKGESKGREDE